MSKNISSINRNIANVSMAAKDQAQDMLVSATRSKKINISENDLKLVIQIVHAAIDSSWGNAEKNIMNSIKKEIEAVSEPKKS